MLVPLLSKQQVELPEFTEDLAIDRDYEERVRGIYRLLVASPTPSPLYNAEPYDYTQEPYFYDLQDRNLRTYTPFQMGETFLSARIVQYTHSYVNEGFTHL